MNPVLSHHSIFKPAPHTMYFRSEIACTLVTLWIYPSYLSQTAVILRPHSKSSVVCEKSSLSVDLHNRGDIPKRENRIDRQLNVGFVKATCFRPHNHDEWNGCSKQRAEHYSGSLHTPCLTGHLVPARKQVSLDHVCPHVPNASFQTSTTSAIANFSISFWPTYCPQCCVSVTRMVAKMMKWIYAHSYLLRQAI